MQESRCRDRPPEGESDARGPRRDCQNTGRFSGPPKPDERSRDHSDRESDQRPTDRGRAGQIVVSLNIDSPCGDPKSRMPDIG